MAPMREIMKKEILKEKGFGMTQTGLWIASGMDIDCAFWEI